MHRPCRRPTGAGPVTTLSTPCLGPTRAVIGYRTYPLTMIGGILCKISDMFNQRKVDQRVCHQKKQRYGDGRFNPIPLRVVDSPRGPGGGVGQEDPHLAVAELALRAAVLPGHLRRVDRLLGKACLVDHHNPLRRPQMVHHVGIQLLHTVGGGVPDQAVHVGLQGVGGSRDEARRGPRCAATLSQPSCQEATVARSKGAGPHYRDYVQVLGIPGRWGSSTKRRS